MIKIEKTEVEGWGTAIRGMRNPLNSWGKSDSFRWVTDDPEHKPRECNYVVGPNDLALAHKLVKSGTDHSKFMRQIIVSTDILAPLYWWKEFDTYKVGTVANSTSTMHTIHKRALTLDDFSHERLYKMTEDGVYIDQIHQICPLDMLEKLIAMINAYREIFLHSHHKPDWDQMIQLLPSSYNQLRTVTMNYQVLRNMYHARKNHKLTEWHDFCAWVEGLPYSELITEG